MKPLFKLFIIISVSALLLTACSHRQNLSENSKSQTVVEFPYYYEGKFPDKEPQSWDEHYNAGVWLFSEGKFSEALNHFIAAVELSKGEAQRTCLTAAAVSALGAGDHRYNNIIDQLELAGPDRQFNEATIIDQVIPVLKDIKYHEGGGHENNS